MFRNIGIYQVLAVVLLVVVIWFGMGKSGDRIVIGVIGPLSGIASPYGFSHRDGIVLAVDQLNAAGGVNGKTIETVILDDVNDKVTAAGQCRDLIYRHQVTAIIGAISSDNTMNMQRICEKAQVPLLTAVSTNPFITRVNFRYTFRCLSDDNIQALELARYSVNVLKLRRVAIIHDSNKYGSMGARTYSTLARSLGQEITTNQLFDGGTTNFRSQLEAVRATNPDGLLVWGLVRESALIIRQAREMGIGVPFFGGDGMAPSTLLDVAGPACEGVILTYPFDPVRGGENARNFQTAFTKAYGTQPDSFAAHGYDAMMLIAQGLRASDGTRRGVRDALSRITQYEGVTGKGGFDSTGNETRSVRLAQVKFGKFVPITSGGSL